MDGLNKIMSSGPCDISLDIIRRQAEETAGPVGKKFQASIEQDGIPKDCDWCRNSRSVHFEQGRNDGNLQTKSQKCVLAARIPGLQRGMLLEFRFLLKGRDQNGKVR